MSTDVDTYNMHRYSTYVSLQQEGEKTKRGVAISLPAQSLYSESRQSRLERDGVSFRAWIVVIVSVSVYGIERRKKKNCVCVRVCMLPALPPGWTHYSFSQNPLQSLETATHSRATCVCVCVSVCRTMAFPLELCLWTIYCKSDRDKEGSKENEEETRREKNKRDSEGELWSCHRKWEVKDIKLGVWVWF